MKKLTPEQEREYFLNKLVEDIRRIIRYEGNDRFMVKLSKKAEIRQHKAGRKYYKQKR